ncbi:SecY-interacting protein [Vibrio maerlii]|uniref:SecY-interacting protein n=1 Tax=Vibrio maerlii TaxID=2231648 RepID=UPI000E3BCE29|nr:SecY-interacting protein [Vibrio maerlii]
MSLTVSEALLKLSQQYQQLWQDKHQSNPRSEELVGIPSPCIQKTTGDYVEWVVVERESPETFANVEQGIELELHSDIKEFYGSQFSADIEASWDGNHFTLLQVWSEEDMTRLQENMLGHLVMQRRLKLKPTIFIGATDDDLEVVSICNLSGNVIVETLGTDKRRHLTDDVETFLQQLTLEV